MSVVVVGFIVGVSVVCLCGESVFAVLVMCVWLRLLR